MVTFTPPQRTEYEIKRGQTSMAVWALQRCLNSFQDWNDGAAIVEDGVFGDRTHELVVKYQGDTGLLADGEAGQKTQARLARSCRYRVDKEGILPKGLVDGLMAGESGGYIAAVNWTVKGGVDCGFTQRRILEPYTEASVKRAFDSMYQVAMFVDTFRERYEANIQRTYVKSRSDAKEFAWRLAALHHNWPYAAGVLADGRQLTTKRATTQDIIGYNSQGQPNYGWIPVSAKFADGSAVATYRDWAKFYAMGSNAHNHKGLVVAQAFGVPIDG